MWLKTFPQHYMSHKATVKQQNTLHDGYPLRIFSHITYHLSSCLMYQYDKYMLQVAVDIHCCFSLQTFYGIIFIPKQINQANNFISRVQLNPLRVNLTFSTQQPRAERSHCARETVWFACATPVLCFRIALCEKSCFREKTTFDCVDAKPKGGRGPNVIGHFNGHFRVLRKLSYTWGIKLRPRTEIISLA